MKQHLHVPLLRWLAVISIVAPYLLLEAQTPSEARRYLLESYIKGSDTNAGDSFGASIAIDRNIAVVGATGRESAFGSSDSSGAAYVFVRELDGEWRQEATLRASNPRSGNLFGQSVAISGDTIVVGAPRERSNATGVNGDDSDTSLVAAGAAYVFERTGGGDWNQTAYLKASNTRGNAEFGFSVAISGDRIIVGSPLENSSATGVDGDQTSTDLMNAGAAYLFRRSGETWTQESYLKASNTAFDTRFGGSVAIGDGLIAIGSFQENGRGQGVNGAQEGTVSSSGAVYLFEQNASGIWEQTTYLKASNSARFWFFGFAIALDGNRIAVGAPGESTAVSRKGAVFLFRRDGSSWTEESALIASNPGDNFNFGSSVGLSGDRLVVGSPFENRITSEINGDQTAAGAANAGAAYLFERSDSGWTQTAYLKAFNNEAEHRFGSSVAIGSDGVLVGAIRETSNATGINGSGSNNTAPFAGAVYAYVEGDLVDETPTPSRPQPAPQVPTPPGNAGIRNPDQPLRPIIGAIGKKRVSTTPRGRVVLRGTAQHGSRIEYRVGGQQERSPKWQRRNVNKSWKLPVRTNLRKVIVRVRLIGEGGSSRFLKYVVTNPKGSGRKGRR